MIVLVVSQVGRGGVVMGGCRHQPQLAAEEDHQQAKQCSGLDKGQVTCWASWHRWTALCLLAYPTSVGTPTPAPRLITTDYSCRI